MNKSSRLSLKIKEAILSHPYPPIDKAEEAVNIADVQKFKMESDTQKQQTGERKLYAKLIYRFIYLWCVAVAILLLGCGCGKIRLSDTVLTTIIGCTTLNVAGFFYLITCYIFKKNKST